jgi:hypothetical protein
LRSEPVRKFRIEPFIGDIIEVVATSYYVSERLVVFEKSVVTGEDREFIPILALQSSDIARIEYIGEHTE